MSSNCDCEGASQICIILERPGPTAIRVEGSTYVFGLPINYVMDETDITMAAGLLEGPKGGL